MAKKADKILELIELKIQEALENAKLAGEPAEEKEEKDAIDEALEEMKAKLAEKEQALIKAQEEIKQKDAEIAVVLDKPGKTKLSLADELDAIIDADL